MTRIPHLPQKLFSCSDFQVSSIPAKPTKTKALLLLLYKQDKLVKDNWEEIQEHAVSPRISFLNFKVVLENIRWYTYFTATKGWLTPSMSKEGKFSHPSHPRFHTFFLKKPAPQESSIFLFCWQEQSRLLTTFLELRV